MLNVGVVIGGGSPEQRFITTLLAPATRPTEITPALQNLIDTHARMRSSFISNYARIVANLAATLAAAQRRVAVSCALMDIDFVQTKAHSYEPASVLRAPIAESPVHAYKRIAERAVAVLTKLVHVQCTRIDTNAGVPPVQEPTCRVESKTAHTLGVETIVEQADREIKTILECGPEGHVLEEAPALRTRRNKAKIDLYNLSRKLEAALKDMRAELVAFADLLFADLEKFHVEDQSTMDTTRTKGESLAIQLGSNYFGALKMDDSGRYYDKNGKLHQWKPEPPEMNRSAIERLAMLADDLTQAVARALTGQLMRISCIGYSLQEMVSNLSESARQAVGLRVYPGLMQQPGDRDGTLRPRSGCLFVFASKYAQEVLNHAGVPESTVRDLASRLTHIERDEHKLLHARRVIAICQRNAARDAWDRVVRAHVEMCCSSSLQPPSQDSPPAYAAVYEELMYDVNGAPFKPGIDVLDLIHEFKSGWHLQKEKKPVQPENVVKPRSESHAPPLEVEPKDRRVEDAVDAVVEEVEEVTLSWDDWGDQPRTAEEDAEWESARPTREELEADMRARRLEAEERARLEEQRTREARARVGMDPATADEIMRHLNAVRTQKRRDEAVATLMGHGMSPEEAMTRFISFEHLPGDEAIEMVLRTRGLSLDQIMGGQMPGPEPTDQVELDAALAISLAEMENADWQ